MPTPSPDLGVGSSLTMGHRNLEPVVQRQEDGGEPEIHVPRGLPQSTYSPGGLGATPAREGKELSDRSQRQIHFSRKPVPQPFGAVIVAPSQR